MYIKNKASFTILKRIIGYRNLCLHKTFMVIYRQNSPTIWRSSPRSGVIFICQQSFGSFSKTSSSFIACFRFYTHPFYKYFAFIFISKINYKYRYLQWFHPGTLYIKLTRIMPTTTELWQLNTKSLSSLG